MKTYLNDNDFYFYYLRYGEDNVPYGCVALRQDSDGNWSRGISLCSNNDQFVKIKAKKIAKGRCVRAIFTKQSTEPIKATDKQVISLAGDWYLANKSDYSVTLTEKEQQITKSNDKPVFGKEII